MLLSLLKNCIKILEKIDSPEAIEIVKQKFDNGAMDRYKKFLAGKEFMVEIPSGEFMMGSNEGEGYESERPIHKVQLTGFWMSKFAVTNELYEKFDPEHKKQRNEYSNTDNQPVIYVNWYEAVMFSRWLGCSLPTEAQWEYACRAETTTAFNTGKELTTKQANFDRNIGKTTPVGKYPANEWGLHDMHGNVYEWCSDWYDEGYYRNCVNEGIIVNPKGPDNGLDRVLRGGTWFWFADCCRSAFRFYDDPANRIGLIGFRLVFIP